MRNKRENAKTIKSKIFFASILQTATPIILFGLITSIVTLSILKVQIVNNTNASFENMYLSVDEFFEKVFDLSQSILYKEGTANAVIFEIENPNYVTELLDDILLNNPEIQAAKIVLEKTEYDASKGKNSIFKYGSVGYKSIVEKINKSKSDFAWYTSYKTTGTTDIFFARAIKNPYTNTGHGMLFFQISDRTFSNLLKVSSKSANSKFTVLSENRLSVVKNFEAPREVINGIYSAKSGTISAEGNYYLFNTIPTYNWKIICCINKWALYKILYLIIFLIVLLCILAIITTTIITKYINKTMVSPIADLSKSMQVWTKKDVYTPPDTDNAYEVKILYDSFSNLTLRVKELINANYKAKILQKDSELKMLRSQINPHFIFNTLETINSFALLYNAEEINAVTTAFAVLIEQSICYDQNTVHSFEEELHLVESYLTIIRIRFGNKVTVVKSIDENTLEIPTPNLIIQPIVENSVSHGILPSGKNCSLEIQSRIEGSDLVVTIKDDGAGISKEKLDELNSILSSEKKSSSKSIGLANVNKRLKLLYGDDYRLKIESEEDKFTKTTVKVAIKPKKSNVKEKKHEI